MSNPVEFREVEPGIVQLTMQDRVNKNTFSPALIQGLTAAFQAVDEHTGYKAVIVTGYDTYFSCGGTQSGLMALQEGRAKFTDVTHYNLPLFCRIPVIAAMQGHAIGGGLVFGLFCDMALFSRESVYTANFMKYGFTPGVGATYILPKKCGTALGAEMLIAARTYRGADLEKRGIAFPVLPRNDVLPAAYELAREIATKPRQSLVALKDHLVSAMRLELPAFLEREVAMHQSTFGLPEVRERIQTLFGQ